MKTARFTLTFLVILSFAGVSANAEIYTFEPILSNEGNWDDGDHWTDPEGQRGTAPGPGDTAIIPDNHRICRVVRIPEGEQCAFLSVNVTSAVEIVGTKLTLGISGMPTLGHDIMGTIRFKEDGGNTPTLKILGFVQMINSLGFVARLSARQFAGLGPGLIEGEAGATLFLDRLTFLVEGSFTITCNIQNRGEFFVDHPLDTLYIGPALTPPEQIELVEGEIRAWSGGTIVLRNILVSTPGDWFSKSGGTIRIESSVSMNSLTGKLDVYQADLDFDVDFATIGDFEFAGGMVDLDANFTTTGVLEFDGGTLDIATGKTLQVGSARISAGDMNLNGNLTVDGDVSGPIRVPQDLTGAIHFGGDLNGTIHVTGDLNDVNADLSGGHIRIDGSLNDDPDAPIEILVDGVFAAPANTEYIAVDYDGWHPLDTWVSGAKVSVDGNTYTGNTPAARVWEITGFKGDMNNDGLVNGADIDPFFLALGDPNQYALNFAGLAGSLLCHADMDEDGFFTGADIDPFFLCLATGGCGCCGGACGFDISPEWVAFMIETHVRSARLLDVIALLIDHAQREPDPTRRVFWNQVVDLLTRG